jgi:hypothetical protein
VARATLASVTSVKVCRRCERVLPIDEFYADRTKRDGHDSRCKSCFRQTHGLSPEGRKYREVFTDISEKVCSRCERSLPIASFGLNKTKQDGHQTYCRDCTGIKNIESRQRDPERLRERRRRAYERNRESLRGKRVRLRHGLTEDDFQLLLEIQGHACAICGARRGSSLAPRLFVDHDHESGEVRGLLCAGCNAGRLGTLGDSVERIAQSVEVLEERIRLMRTAIEYLREPPARKARLRGVS